jgi:aminoglycoside phosphotransferase (APT) family kinase protein
VAGLHLAWGRLATSAQVLTHNDFWSGNTLWAAGQLTGVVDWSGAGLAPRGFDLSWARLDLFLLHDRGVADAMTSAYETAADLSVPDVDVWDVYAATKAHAGIEGWAPDYRDLGRPDLGPAELRRRLGEWMLPTFTTDASAGR